MYILSCSKKFKVANNANIMFKDMTNVAIVSIIRLGAGWRIVFRIVSSEEAQ